jgi:hypothetical protein
MPYISRLRKFFAIKFFDENDNQMINLKEMISKQSFNCHFSLEKNEFKNINDSIYDMTFTKLMAIIKLL